MFALANQTCRITQTSISFCNYLIDCCFSSKSLTLAKSVHAHFIRLGFNRYTFLGNRCLDLYSQFGVVDDAFKVFEDISFKNSVSWNICLKGFVKSGDLVLARYVFDKMPERDVVSWNSMISGYVAFGYSDQALETLWEMQRHQVRPSEFTNSILTSIVDDVRFGKELHGSMIRSCSDLSGVVLGNSLIDMYGRIGCFEYALGVFFMMREVDVISWNSIITRCNRTGYGELALDLFWLMRSSGYSPNEFTCSAVISSCSNLRNLGKGYQIFAFVIKAGFLHNITVSSSAINLFSKCNRLDDSIQLFKDLNEGDSSLCNSMISTYASHDLGDYALYLFVLTFQVNIRPSEFTLSSMLSSVSFLTTEQGTQIHSLVVKSGFELDPIVASSLLSMYSKFGFIDHGIKIFSKMHRRDLISWNSLIWGLACNGRVSEAINMFKELLVKGPPPDRITLAAVLLACSHGGFVDEGLNIFSSMKEEYGITPGIEHYTCVVDLLCRAGMIDEALLTAEGMPFPASSFIWESILRACAAHENVKLAEKVAERMIALEIQSSLPYVVLTRIYELRAQWEKMVCVGKNRRKTSIAGYSAVGIKDQVYTFNARQLQHHGGKDICSVLRLISWEIETDWIHSND